MPDRLARIKSRGVNRTPLPGSGGLAAGSLLAGKAPTAAGFALYRGSVQSANSKKKYGAGESVCSDRKRAGILLSCSVCTKKRRPTLRESRSSFKEKGDKSCFTDLYQNATTVPVFSFFFFLGFLVESWAFLERGRRNEKREDV